MSHEQLDLFDTYYEDPNIDNINLNQVGFKVHASLIYKLGEELIADEVTAISELVKNSYDADSPFVNLLVDPYYEEEIEDSTDNKTKLLRGIITISDAGHGMDKNDIINGWLTISNSIKKKMKKDRQVTKKYERMPLGDKGLGRLSVQKLGNYMYLKTKKTGAATEYTVHIPWGHFRKNTTIDNVPVKVVERVVSVNEIEKGYTEIVIKDLVNPELWSNANSVFNLEKELSQIVSPFKTTNNTFYVYAKVGTKELNFNAISDEALNGAISRYSFSLNNGEITIEGLYKLDFFEGKSETLIHEDHIREFINNTEVLQNDCEYIDSGDGYCIKFKQVIMLENLSELRTDKMSKKILSPGNFFGQVYSYSLDPSAIKTQIEKLNFEFLDDMTKFRNYISNNKGIKVFRDDFSILPYGYGGNDWLNLSASASTKGKFTDLKNDTVIGYIQLPGKESYNLREKTNREGFIADDYYHNFEVIIKHAIRRINRNREKLKGNFNKFITQLNGDKLNSDPLVMSHEHAINKMKSVAQRTETIATKIDMNRGHIKKAEGALQSVVHKIEHLNMPIQDREILNEHLYQLRNNITATTAILSEAADYINELGSLKNQLKVIEFEYSQLVERMEEISELAGLGIVAETLTHELNTLVSNTKKNTDDASEYFKKTFQADKKMDRYFNFVKYSSDSIRKQVSHLSPSFRSVRTVKKTMNIKDVLVEHLEHYLDRAKRYGITLKIQHTENDFRVHVSLGMLHQVLDNLYLNSEHWLSHAMKINKIQTAEYVLELRANGLLRIWDNGIGIDPSIENQVFEPFVTNKKDGRGLGLYIVTKLLHYNNCSIRLMRERNEYNNLYIFELDFSKCLRINE
jgi:nitrogen-specific signal transduction histidine kinase